VSLAYLQYVLLGIRTTKEYQVSDFTERPLPDSILKYAAEDVVHLPPLKEALLKRLESLQRTELVYKVSGELFSDKQNQFKPLSIASFRNAWQLDSFGLAALQYLIDWYNGLSEKDRLSAPKHKILFSIASLLPATRKELMKIPGVPYRFAQKEGDKLTGHLNRAGRRGTNSMVIPEPKPYETFFDYKIKAWLSKAAAEVSEKLSVSPKLVFPQWLLSEMEHKFKAGGDIMSILDILAGWRKELLASELEDYINLNRESVPQAG
jgi:ribonuclease D